MGLTMPAYAYYLARGRERKDPNKPTGWNKKSEDAIGLLFELLDHPLIKEIAVCENAVSSRFPDIDLRECNWRSGTMIEKDRLAREELEQILDGLQNRGTVVVPSIGHLKANHKLMHRLCDHPIAPIAIDRAKVKIAMLKRALLRLPDGRSTAEFEKMVCDFFSWLTQSALNNQRQLQTSRLHHPRASQQVIRSKRAIKKPAATKAAS